MMEARKIQNLEASVLRILNHSGITVGTGFVIADRVALTCSHVVQTAGSGRGQPILVQFYSSEHQQKAQVSSRGWSSQDADDVAFLELDSLPEGAIPLILGSAKGCDEHRYRTCGFTRFANYDFRKVSDNLDGVVSVADHRKHPMLQLKGEEIDKGLSGSPVLDTKTNRVVGMISEYKDNEHTRLAWATTVETLATLDPSLKIWSDTYDPIDLHNYLQHLINTNRVLSLADGRQVLLERVYVSLHADKMNAAERQAERDIFLEDVAELQKLTGVADVDEYTKFEAIRKVIARRPRMRMLEVRNWERLFGEREQSSLSLAEVIQRHQHVVLLGDPGSGKTTLGKWLMLQFARGLQVNQSKVEVRADKVRPGDSADKLIDLGSALLPIFIRITDFVRARWDKDEGDTGLSLERFIGHHYSQKSLPLGLSSEVVNALTQDYLSSGQALVVLDGLDEVGDPFQRRLVMQAVNSFLQDQDNGNRVVLTSRIVGYQFQPLTRLPHYTIEDMDEVAITAFCKAWMMHVAEVDDPNKQARKLKDAIFDQAHPGVRTLAGNPLLLTILAQVYWAKHTLPNRRVELFEAAAQALYDQRKDDWKRVNISQDLLTRALGAVAAHIHANEVTGFSEEGTVRARLADILHYRDQVQTVLNVARDVSGCLVARGEGVYGFLHRSLQEYFAAKHLIDFPKEVATSLAGRLLDPIWREPIVLATGLVSEPRYEDSLKHLREVFDTLLDTPDPAGKFLPRRELLAVSACSECVRVPPETGQRIAKSLITLYAEYLRGGRKVLWTRVHHAFNSLFTSVAKDQVESLLREAVEDPSFWYRYSAVEIIFETRWDSPAIARALVRSWYTYADPAASLLAALDAISIRQPAYFESDFLPFRRALESESTLMERIKSFEWQEVITSLYFPLEANFRADLINRDSPLTEELLKLLRQSVDPDLPKSDLSAELLKFLKLTAQVSTNSGEIRDAALSLSVLGDESWIKSFLANSGHQKYLLRPFIVCIAKALAIVFNRNRTRTLFSTFDRDLANVRTYNRELHRAFTRASNYTTDIMRILDLVQLRATACINIRSIDNANESVEVLTTFSSNAHTCTRDLIEAQKLGYKIVEAIQSVKSRWRLDIQLMKRLESLLNSILNIYTFITTYAFVAKSWESLLAACKEPLVTEARSSNEPSEMTLSDLMLNLGSSNDTLRESAQKILMTPRRASFVGKVLIEQMAEIACSSVGMISSQMECSLQMIIHDTSSWIDQWIKQIEEADERCIAEVIVGSIHRITPKAFPAILNALHDPSPRTSMPLLKSLSWLARSEQIPKELEKSTREKLLAWLDREGDPNTQGSIISVLGYWHAHPDIISDALLIRLRWPIMSSVFPALYTALARLCMERPDYDKAVWRTIVSACPHPAAAAALVRLSLKKVKSRSSTEKSTPVENRQLDAPKNPGTKLLDEVTKALPDVSNCLIALLEAGTDDDNWDDEYHGIIVKAIRELLEHSASLLPTLLIRLQLAISERNWPSRRIILAAVAACSEVMPIAVQRACPGNLEILLVKAATDAESYTSRRFAIRALSYLRTVTPAIIPALLAGCQDIKAVQNDTIAAASGFQTIEGVPFPLGRLTDALTGESTSTAYAVIQLLGALGASAAGEASDLREQIIEALVGALKNPISKKKLLIPGQNEIKLEDALYTALLQVTGWIG